MTKRKIDSSDISSNKRRCLADLNKQILFDMNNTEIFLAEEDIAISCNDDEIIKENAYLSLIAETNLINLLNMEEENLIKQQNDLPQSISNSITNCLFSFFEASQQEHLEQQHKQLDSPYYVMKEESMDELLAIGLEREYKQVQANLQPTENVKAIVEAPSIHTNSIEKKRKERLLPGTAIKEFWQRNENERILVERGTLRRKNKKVLPGDEFQLKFSLR